MTKRGKLSLDVEFGGVSYGTDTGRMGVRVSRDRLDVGDAEEMFCGRRLTFLIESGTNGDAPNQRRNPADAYEEIKATCDVKRIGLTTKHIGFGLTFSRREVRGTLEHFAKSAGRLTVLDVADIPEDDEDEDEPEEEGQGTMFDADDKRGKKK